MDISLFWAHVGCFGAHLGLTNGRGRCILVVSWWPSVATNCHYWPSVVYMCFGGNKAQVRWIAAYFGTIWGVFGSIWAVGGVFWLFLVPIIGHHWPPLATSSLYVFWLVSAQVSWIPACSGPIWASITAFGGCIPVVSGGH